MSEQKHKMGIEKEAEIWYAMRATYRREPDAMHLLKKENLGCFIPMQYKICIKKRKKVRALVPVVHNLLLSMPVLPMCSVSSLKSLICNISPIPAVGRRLLSQTVRCSVSLPYPALTMIIFFIFNRMN